ncbi:MAG: hypothetical protein SYR96_21350 [Actinomycetota bacterium]|nr:hypothetical protein [Actinomycetota bacterium]
MIDYLETADRILANQPTAHELISARQAAYPTRLNPTTLTLSAALLGLTN